MLATRFNHVYQLIVVCFTKKASALPIAALRIALSTLLLFDLCFVFHDLQDLYGVQGILQGTIVDSLGSMALPNIRWMQEFAYQQWDLSYAVTFGVVVCIYAVSVVMLLVGWHGAVAAFVSWILHYLIFISGYVHVYGVDHFASIFLFLLTWMPLSSMWSLDSKRSDKKPPSAFWTSISLRLLQFEMCIIYFSAGYHKLLGDQWRSGEAIWRSTNLPLFEPMIPTEFIGHFPMLMLAAAWGTIIIEIGYPVFIWFRSTRALWLVACVGMHLGIAVTIGLVYFSVVMAMLSLCIFGLDHPKLRRGI